METQCGAAAKHTHTHTHTHTHSPRVIKPLLSLPAFDLSTHRKSMGLDQFLHKWLSLDFINSSFNSSGTYLFRV